MVKLLKRKTEIPAATRALLGAFHKWSGKEARRLRTDYGTEFKSQQMDEALKDLKVLQEFASPYCPAANGAAERLMRTLLVKTRCLLADSGLPKSDLWLAT